MLRTNWQNSLLRDERFETRLWANLASAQTSDSILPPGMTGSLHMSAADRTAWKPMMITARLMVEICEGRP